MLDAVIASFVDRVTEREMDAPFMALLRSRGFYDVHFVHGPFEFGKDFIAKREESGTTCQYVFQSKQGNIATAEWDRGLGQLDRLRRSALAHPSFDVKAPRRAVLLLTGRLVGAAAINAQEYCSDLVSRGEIGLEIWDRERLIELAGSAVASGLVERTEGPLLGLLAAIDDRSVTDGQLERFSRRWCLANLECWPCVLEAAVVAERLQRSLRADLACLTGLALVRAACWQTHDPVGASSDWEVAAQLGRLMFVTYADVLWRRATESTLNDGEVIAAHSEPAALVTHSIRCLRLAELVALFGLAPEIPGRSIGVASVAAWLTDFVSGHRAASRPLSDRWAVSLVPPVLLLASHGRLDDAGRYLQAVIRWVGDRYGENAGLASCYASPAQEVRQVFGTAIPPRDVARRSESQVAAVVLELAAFLRLPGTYRLALNDFDAVNALPSVLTSQDSRGQYVIDAVDVSRDPNVRFQEELPLDWLSAAPHLRDAARSRVLQARGRSWDHLAISALLRDRHFVSAWPEF